MNKSAQVFFFSMFFENAFKRQKDVICENRVRVFLQRFLENSKLSIFFNQTLIVGVVFPQAQFVLFFTFR